MAKRKLSAKAVKKTVMALVVKEGTYYKHIKPLGGKR